MSLLTHSLPSELHSPSLTSSLSTKPSTSVWSHFQVAIEEAMKSEDHNQHGAVVVKGGKILARGHNSVSPFPFRNVFSGSCFTHAEVDALFNYYSRNTTSLRGSLRKGSQDL